MQTKLTFQKLYVIFLAILGALILLIGVYSIVGFFTSMQDDEMYVNYIKNDLDTMRKDLNNTHAKKVRKLIDNGAMFMTYNKRDETIVVKKPSSSSFPKIMKAIYSANTKEFLAVLDKNEEFSVEKENFLRSEIMESNGLFASFGDAFAFRLLLVMKKIVDGIKELTLQSDESKDSYLSILVDQQVVILTLFEESSSDEKFLVSRLEYLIPEKDGRPKMKQIMQHVCYRLFCTE